MSDASDSPKEYNHKVKINQKESSVSGHTHPSTLRTSFVISRSKKLNLHVLTCARQRWLSSWQAGFPPLLIFFPFSICFCIFLIDAIGTFQRPRSIPSPLFYPSPLHYYLTRWQEDRPVAHGWMDGPVASQCVLQRVKGSCDGRRHRVWYKSRKRRGDIPLYFFQTECSAPFGVVCHVRAFSHQVVLPCWILRWW